MPSTLPWVGAAAVASVAIAALFFIRRDNRKLGAAEKELEVSRGSLESIRKANDARRSVRPDDSLHNDPDNRDNGL